MSQRTEHELNPGRGRSGEYSPLKKGAIDILENARFYTLEKPRIWARKMLENVRFSTG